eukprot:895007-Karenia_brevis.AAC.1
MNIVVWLTFSGFRRSSVFGGPELSTLKNGKQETGPPLQELDPRNTNSERTPCEFTDWQA